MCDKSISFLPQTSIRHYFPNDGAICSTLSNNPSSPPACVYEEDLSSFPLLWILGNVLQQPISSFATEIKSHKIDYVKPKRVGYMVSEATDWKTSLNQSTKPKHSNFRLQPDLSVVGQIGKIPFVDWSGKLREK
ncbi:PREDICTED: uncharacterized protein LOC101294173 [Fragaria vesca subsp. vesca]